MDKHVAQCAFLIVPYGLFFKFRNGLTVWVDIEHIGHNKQTTLHHTP